ncbi:MAG: hypothetical protein IT425_15325 [Pirellulales bacterium]|nr:hypothetical protein [Pirellulales bacterium]
MCGKQFVRNWRVAVAALAYASAALITASNAWAVEKGARESVLAAEVLVQFQLAYRLHPAEYDRRCEQLAGAVAAWRTAPRSAENDELLNQWLRAAMRSSMPGSRLPLPAAPIFAGVENKAQPAPAESVANSSPSQVQPGSKATADSEPSKHTEAPPKDAQMDPFGDDPLEEPEF